MTKRLYPANTTNIVTNAFKICHIKYMGIYMGEKSSTKYFFVFLTNRIFQETKISVITKHYIHIDILHDHHPTYAKVDTSDM